MVFCSVLSCSSAGRVNAGTGAVVEQVKVKQEPGTEDSYSCPTSSLKTERGKDGRSACMVGILFYVSLRNYRVGECGLHIICKGVTESWECYKAYANHTSGRTDQTRTTRK